MLIADAPATSWPVTVAEACGQLGMGSGELSQFAALLDRLIRAATDLVQREAAVTLQPTDFTQRLDGWPSGPVALETGPVREVVEVAYLGADGGEAALDGAAWDWEPTAEGGMVWLKAGFSPPALQRLRPGAVRIRFSAGFNDPTATQGDPRLALPERARHAVLALVAHWFRNREAEGETPPAADRLIHSIRVFR